MKTLGYFKLNYALLDVVAIFYLTILNAYAEHANFKPGEWGMGDFFICVSSHKFPSANEFAKRYALGLDGYGVSGRIIGNCKVKKTDYESGLKIDLLCEQIEDHKLLMKSPVNITADFTNNGKYIVTTTSSYFGALARESDRYKLFSNKCYGDFVYPKGVEKTLIYAFPKNTRIKKGYSLPSSAN